MKKTIAIVAVSILSLLNGFAANSESRQIKALSKSMLPIMIVGSLSFAFDEYPSLVKKVARENYINLNLDEVKKNCARLNKELEIVFDQKLERKIEKFDDEKFEKKLSHEISSMCLRKHNMDLSFKAIEALDNVRHGATSDRKRIIECLLRSYTPRLVSQLEEMINSAKNHR